MSDVLGRPLLLLGLVTLVGWVVLGLRLATGNRRIDFLRDESPVEVPDAPALSVVVPARNEERKIRPALRTVLEQDYPGLQVIAVDDRSTDATGEILDEMASEYAGLEVVHLEELPEGWLGKNHALHRGADRADGELLLFTDADVMMEPDALRRAAGYLEREGLDHITVIPDLTLPGRLLEAVTGTFKMLFGIYFRPWRARDPDSDRYVGTGAFNLVRAGAYREVGGHDPIALRPADDLKLGRLLKRQGYRQAAVFGHRVLSVEWYASLGDLVRGLEKNAYSVAGYSLLRVAIGTAGLLLFVAWPSAAVVLTEGTVRWMNAGIVAVLCAIYADNARFYGHSPWHGLALPFTATVLAYIGWRSALKALTTGRIEWRDTAYDLEELRGA